MKRILLVDDSSGILDVFRFAFALAGFQVETATSGRVAVRKAAEEDPDLVVTDLNLRDIDPRQLLRGLRRRPEREEERPVIVMTGMEVFETADIIENEDVLLVRKPFDVWELVARVQSELMPTAGQRS